MAISCTITRTALSLSALEMVGANGYNILSDGLDPGGVKNRREWAKSPFVHGGALLSAVDDIAAGKIQVEVIGTSRSDVQTKVTTLITAFKQLQYTLTFNLDGTSWAWTCYRADRTQDFDFPFYLDNLTVVSFDFPRDPIASSGPY